MRHYKNHIPFLKQKSQNLILKKKESIAIKDFTNTQYKE